MNLSPRSIVATLVLAACAALTGCASKCDVDNLGKRFGDLEQALIKSRPQQCNTVAAPAPAVAPAPAPIVFVPAPTPDPAEPIVYTRTVKRNSQTIGNDGKVDMDITSNDGDVLKIEVTGASGPLDLRSVLAADPALIGNAPQSDIDRLRARYADPQPAARMNKDYGRKFTAR